MPQIYQKNIAALKMLKTRCPVTAGMAKTVTTAKARRLEASVSSGRHREMSQRAWPALVTAVDKLKSFSRVSMTFGLKAL